MTDNTLVSLYVLIPVAASLLGGILASLIRTPHKLLSMVQYLLAGVLLAVISTEFTPKLIGLHKEKEVLIGGVIGLVSFVLIYWIINKGKHLRIKTFPIGNLLGSLTTLFLDGTLIGIAFVADMKSGLFVAEALAVCIFLTSYRLAEKISGNIIKTIITLLLTAMLPLGVYLGYDILKLIGTKYYYEVLAFGTIGLLYLSFEKLLSDAETEKTTISIPLLFLGFILILIVQG